LKEDMSKHSCDFFSYIT